MTKDTSQDAHLDALFDEAAQAQPIPSADLLARLAQDAAQVQQGFDAPALSPQPPRAAWRRWLAEIGGFPALGGLAVSACVGGYIGFVNPEMTLSVPLIVGAEATLDAEDPFSTPMLGDLDWIDEG